MKIIQNFNNTPDETSIFCICVVRDEQLLIPAFIEHYTNLSVTHFIFIDNGSLDNSIHMLKSQHPHVNIQIWQTYENYSDNMFGVSWVNQVMDNQCKHRWCLVVDIDELLLLESGQKLPDLIKQMNRDQSNVLQTLMIDFYPKSFAHNQYKSGESPLKHSCYYDMMNHDNVFTQTALDNTTGVKGGLRHRILRDGSAPGNESVCLSKRSFFFYDYYDTHHLDVGMHWILPNDFEDWCTYSDWDMSNKHLKIHPQVALMAHFKFVKPDIEQFIQQRIDRGQDWDDSSEYKKYKHAIMCDFYDDTISRRYTTIENLYNDTLHNIT